MRGRATSTHASSTGPAWCGTPTTTAPYARQASTDGRRVVYQCAGELWILDDLEPDSEPQRVGITLGSAAAARAPRLVSAQDHLGDLSCDTTGRASAVEVRGTVHWLTHRDGPARALAVTPDARARMPRVLGRTGGVVWVSDAGGPDALEIAPAGGPGLTAAGGSAAPRRLRKAPWDWSASWRRRPTGQRWRWPPGTAGCTSSTWRPGR